MKTYKQCGKYANFTGLSQELKLEVSARSQSPASSSLALGLWTSFGSCSFAKVGA